MQRSYFHRFKGLSCSLCLGIVASSWADEIVPPLEPLVVSAARFEQAAAETPFSVAVATARDLEEKSVRSLPEALAELPGVMVQKTANGQGSPYLRGFTGYRTLALVDGVRYNNSVYRDGPNEYFSLIDFHTLERIELLGGPASVQYGSDAIGGTLNLLTRSADFMSEQAGDLYQHGSQFYRYSSAENSHITRTTAEIGSGGAWGLLLGITNEHFGDIEAAQLGTQRNTGYDQYGIDTRYDWEISNQWHLTLNHQNSSQNDVWRTHSTIFSESFSGAETGTDLRRLKDQAHSLNYAKLTGKDLNSIIDEATFTLSFQTWDEQGDRIKADSSRSLESFDSRMLGADLQLKSDLPHGKLIYGGDIYHDSVDSARADYRPDGSLEQVRIQGPVGDDSSQTLLGSYVQGIFPLGKQMEVIAGSRFTYAAAEVGRYEDPATGMAKSFADAWGNLSSSIRLSYALDDSWKLWGGVSQAFRSPNLGDLSRYGDSRTNETEVAATGLTPEHFITYELGLKGTQGPFTGSATAYHTDIQDYIASTPTGNITDGLIEVTKRNSGSGGVSGIELAGIYQVDSSWLIRGNLTYLRGNLTNYVDATSPQIIDEPMSRVQPLTVNLALRWDSPDHKWWGEISGTFAAAADRLSAGDKLDTQRIPPGGTPGYALLGISGGYQVNDNLRLSLAAENLLNQAYRTHGSGSNEPGFGLTTSISVSF